MQADEAQAFYEFIQEVILPYEPKGFKEYSEFHLNIIYRACKEISTTAAPRGSLKSTILARYRTLFKLVDPIVHEFRPNAAKDSIDILLVSETAGFAQEHLAWIKHQIMHNEVLQDRYGILKPQESDKLPWNQDEVQLTNGTVS